MRFLFLLLLPMLLLGFPPVLAAEKADVLKSARRAPKITVDTSATPGTWTAEDRAQMDRMNAYLNRLRTLSATFTQVSDMGEVRKGVIWIQRPGRMRVTYDPPVKDFIVADGKMLTLWDDEMGQQSSVPLDSTLAAFILRDSLRLEGGDVTLTAFAHTRTQLEATLVSTKDPGEGSLTLVMEDRPLALRQWRVRDSQNRVTVVTLENLREPAAFEKGAFDFVPPLLGKPQGRAKVEGLRTRNKIFLAPGTPEKKPATP